MIRLGLRLSLRGGREAAIRLAITAAAVAIGVGLLLMTLAGMNAIKSQNDRSAWLNTGQFHPVGPVTSHAAGPAAAYAAPLWWSFTSDQFARQTIDRIDLATTGPDAPVPPGIGGLPGPGQFYASPALTRLLRSTSGFELADRFPGRQIGTIGASALPSPNSLIIVIGRSSAQVSTLEGASEVDAINTTAGHAGGSTGWDDNKLQVILAVGALALLFPVLIFIATATRLAAARREQRFAAIRLVGGTPRQISVISAVEAAMAAIGGVAVGFALFVLLRAALAQVPFTGAPFVPGDLSLRGGDIFLVVVGVPIAAIGAARLSLRRVRISPLGVSRRVTPPAPGPNRLIPLAAGIAELVYFLAVGHPSSTGGQILAYFSGCLLTVTGLLVSGPWLTLVASRAMASRTSRPEVLLSGRRLADDPRAAFRAIGGLIVAIFITSVSVGVISTVVDYHRSTSGSAASRTLLDEFVGGPGRLLATPSIPASLVTALRSLAGVDGVTLIYDLPGAGPLQPDADHQLVSCDQLADTPAVGHCGTATGVGTITGGIAPTTVTGSASLAGRVWPSASIPILRLITFPVRAIVVETQRSNSDIERARTALEVALPAQGPPTTLNQISVTNMRTIAELRQLTNVVIVASLIIGGCSLAVAVTAGVNDRKRPFSLLRLAGVPVAVLRRVVVLEAVIPLVALAAFAATAGFAAAALFLRSQLGETLRPPGLSYYVLLVAGLAASLSIIAATLPLIERITGHEVARNE